MIDGGHVWLTEHGGPENGGTHKYPGGDCWGTHICGVGHTHSADGNVSSQWSPKILSVTNFIYVHINKEI